jgi:transcriptional regulator of arginine metabolism
MSKKTESKKVISAQQRKVLIAELIALGLIASQGDAVIELKKRGVTVTQATASRDLQELGALKGKGASGEIRYELPAGSSNGLGAQLLLSVTASGNIVVVRTPTAAAQLLASAIDAAVARKELTSAIGTIAGDDTVLVISATATGGAALAKKMQSMFGKVK